jgi:plastocyanin
MQHIFQQERGVNRGPATVMRVVAGAAVIVGGLIHLQLYFDGYRDIADANLGRSFLLNVIASAILGSLLIVTSHPLVRLGAIGLSASTLVAFALARTDQGIFGFSENGLNPSPQAVLALVVEIAALVLLAATFLPAIGGGVDLARATLVPVVGLVALVTIGAGALWARSSDEPVVADDTSVVIENFEFDPPQFDVAPGQTVTWTNADGFEHTIVAGDGSFASDVLGSGAEFSHTFDGAGEFAYTCGIHPTMAGTIVVQE